MHAVSTSSWTLRLIVFAGIALAALGTITLVTAHGGAPALVHSCVRTVSGPGGNPPKGQIRIVGASEGCTPNIEASLDWNQQGVPGPIGPTGPAGISAFGYIALANQIVIPSNGFIPFLTTGPTNGVGSQTTGFTVLTSGTFRIDFTSNDAAPAVWALTVNGVPASTGLWDSAAGTNTRTITLTLVGGDSIAVGNASASTQTLIAGVGNQSAALSILRLQ